uniref:Uncharacterized protein n=1 Tax=Anguilla anguilla TaxID=7936 RepID=A0A0E9PGB7_ANGAN
MQLKLLMFLNDHEEREKSLSLVFKKEK